MYLRDVAAFSKLDGLAEGGPVDVAPKDCVVDSVENGVIVDEDYLAVSGPPEILSWVPVSTLHTSSSPV
jgi:hypothetical protein